jgi:hypothetical protein
MCDPEKKPVATLVRGEAMAQSIRPSFWCLLCWQLISASLLWAQQPGLQVSILAGEGASNYIDNRRTTAPVVQVLDAQGEPVAGAEVRFATPLTGPTVTFFGGVNAVTLLSDQEGRAQAPAILPNTYEGPFTIEVTASQEGRGATASIHQTNTFAQPPPKKKIRLGWRAWAGIGAAAVIGIVAAVNGSD